MTDKPDKPEPKYGIVVEVINNSTIVLYCATTTLRQELTSFTRDYGTETYSPYRISIQVRPNYDVADVARYFFSYPSGMDNKLTDKRINKIN